MQTLGRRGAGTAKTGGAWEQYGTEALKAFELLFHCESLFSNGVETDPLL